MNDPDPASLIVKRLETVPAEADAALILRHAEREDIPPGTFGVDVPLTARGIASAERLGAMLSDRRPRTKITASPVSRCVATARAMLHGGGWSGDYALDWLLGDPGPFVVDADVAGTLFLDISILEIVRRQLSHTEPPSGMRGTSEGVDLLLRLAADNLRSCGQLNIYVTHDAILVVLVAHLYQMSVDEVGWPGYLDGLLLWRSSERLCFAWRELQQTSHPLGG